MFGGDLAQGLIAVPYWAAGALAALFVAGCVLAFNRSGTGAIGGAVRVSIIILGALMVWTFVERAALRDRDADGRAIETRAAELTARAVAAGSPLACLDGIAGETVEAACEKAIFASPEAVAAAMSYVSARLTLLADVLAYDRTSGKSINISPSALRRSLDKDRYGFVAHVLSMRDGCIGPNCKAFEMLGDATRVRANLATHELDRYLNHYAEEWAKEPVNPAPPAPVAEAAPAKPKVSVNIDFPSAASIPAVSIMNAEPTGPVLPGVAQAAAANPNPPPSAPPQATSRRSSRKHAATPPQPAAAPPVQSAAQPVTPQTATAVVPAPAMAPTPAIPASPAMSGPPATTGPAVVPPVQLVPSFPPPAGASAGLQ
jgi:hypothetical protein